MVAEYAAGQNNMISKLRQLVGTVVPMAGLLSFTTGLSAQDAARFGSIQRGSDGDFVLQMSAPNGSYYRLDASSDLQNWISLITTRSTGSIQHPDSATPYFGSRFYRAIELGGTNLFTGDHLATATGDVLFHPINHASLVMKWNEKMIYSDPVGGSAPYTSFPRADLILVTHSHSDHFDSATLTAVRSANSVIIAPQAVYSSLSATLKSLTIVLANGAKTNVMDLTVEAVPAYNLTSSNHPKGAGNGYVVTIGGKRIYLSGDTEDVPETRALRDVDVAFLCMNVPYTMTGAKAISTLRDFHPKVVYPYHFRNSDSTFTDLNSLKRQVGTDLGTEVRVRKWY